MKLKFVLPVIVFILCCSFAGIDYTGPNLLTTIGFSVTSKEFKEVKQFWLLDKNLENNFGGIKFLPGNTGKVQSILIAGQNFQQNGTKFFACTSPLPYGILLTDDTATLNKKLGEGIKIPGRSAMKFYEGPVAVEVAYKDLTERKILFIKFYTEVKPVAKLITTTVESKLPSAKDKLAASRHELEQKTFTPPAEKATATEASTSSFKKALLNVFIAYKESNFSSIKNGLRNTGNFWNYKFTYTTKLKIPGERFNMLYSFPFQNSELDFVSVIKEADAYDASFQSTYKEFEKKLMQNFPASEGWKASCIPNKESKTLSDLELSNDKYGSIILDYSKNPRGRHILYLRFLLNEG